MDINEGLKAQSLEKLIVLELLGVKDLIFVLNKCDLCEDIDAKTKEIAAQHFSHFCAFKFGHRKT